MDFDELVMKIVKASGLNKDDVLARINSKVAELSGLVSKRGAAHIVANGFGIKVHESKKGKVLDLKDLVSGLNNVSVKGVVTRVFPVNEFDKNGKKGKVASVLINDGTGDSRLVFWNDMANIISSSRLNEGDFVIAHHLRSKQGMYGIELHLSNRSRLDLNPDDEKRPEVKSSSVALDTSKRFLICDIQQGLNVEIRGCLVQLYDRSPFYLVCPECGSSAKDNKCSEHGEVKPKKAFVLNAVFDDGTGTVRCVFFKEQAESLLGCSTEHAVKLAEDKGNDAAIIHEKKDLLGEEFIISGKVNHNDFTDNLEITARSIIRANPVKEVKKLLN
jgi:ssDNA-binding replication factor A large subunit